MTRHKEFDFDSLPQGSKDVYELRLKAPDLTRLAERRSDDLRRHGFPGRDF